jgi:hypothetical protein
MATTSESKLLAAIQIGQAALIRRWSDVLTSADRQFVLDLTNSL